MSEKYQLVENAFSDGTITDKDSDTLGAYLLTLSNQPILNDRVRHRDIIRGLTLNHILLQRHISALEKRNATTQWLVIALAVAALITGGVQIVYAFKADKRAGESELTHAGPTPEMRTDRAKATPTSQGFQPPQVLGDPAMK